MTVANPAFNSVPSTSNEGIRGYKPVAVAASDRANEGHIGNGHASNVADDSDEYLSCRSGGSLFDESHLLDDEYADAAPEPVQRVSASSASARPASIVLGRTTPSGAMHPSNGTVSSSGARSDGAGVAPRRISGAGDGGRTNGTSTTAGRTGSTTDGGRTTPSRLSSDGNNVWQQRSQAVAGAHATSNGAAGGAQSLPQPHSRASSSHSISASRLAGVVSVSGTTERASGGTAVDAYHPSHRTPTAAATASAAVATDHRQRHLSGGKERLKSHPVKIASSISSCDNAIDSFIGEVSSSGELPLEAVRAAVSCTDAEAVQRALLLYQDKYAKGRGVEVLLRQAGFSGSLVGDHHGGGAGRHVHNTPAKGPKVLPPSLRSELLSHGKEGRELLDNTERLMRDIQDFDDDSGWTLILDGELRVLHRGPESGSTAHGFRGSAILEAPLEQMLCLMREFDLMKTWNKYMTESAVLCDYSWDNVLVCASMWLPWPLSSIVLTVGARAVEVLEGEGFLIVSFATAPLPPGVELLASCAKMKPVDVLPGSCLRLEPLPPLQPGGPPRTRVSASTTVDAHIKFIPSFVLNFVLKIFAPFLYHTAVKLVRKEFPTTPPAPGQALSPLAQRLADKPALYGHVAAEARRRVASALAAQQRRLAVELRAAQLKQQAKQETRRRLSHQHGGGGGHEGSVAASSPAGSVTGGF